MEGNSRVGAVVLTHLLSTEGLSVIPFVLERRDREELQFAKEMWCSVDRHAKPWASVNCVTPHLHRGCVGSVLVLGSCVLTAWPLGGVGAALCLCWSMGWDQELQALTGAEELNRVCLTLALCRCLR